MDIPSDVHRWWNIYCYRQQMNQAEIVIWKTRFKFGNLVISFTCTEHKKIIRTFAFDNRRKHQHQVNFSI